MNGLMRVVAVSVLLSPTAALADDWDTEDAAHSGPYLRLLLGPSLTVMQSGLNSVDVSVTGTGAEAQLQAGFAIIPGFILYGALTGNSLVNPTVEVGPISYQDDSRVLIIGVHGGFTHYVGGGVYYSASIGTERLTVESDEDGDGDVESVSDPNFGVSIRGALGKEWPVFPGVGMGVALTVAAGAFPDAEFDNWSSGSVGVLFSATYSP